MLAVFEQSIFELFCDGARLSVEFLQNENFISFHRDLKTVRFDENPPRFSHGNCTSEQSFLQQVSIQNPQNRRKSIKITSNFQFQAMILVSVFNAQKSVFNALTWMQLRKKLWFFTLPASLGNSKHVPFPCCWLLRAWPRPPLRAKRYEINILLDETRFIHRKGYKFGVSAITLSWWHFNGLFFLDKQDFVRIKTQFNIAFLLRQSKLGKGLNLGMKLKVISRAKQLDFCSTVGDLKTLKTRRIEIQ